MIFAHLCRLFWWHCFYVRYLSTFFFNHSIERFYSIIRFLLLCPIPKEKSLLSTAHFLFGCYHQPPLRGGFVHMTVHFHSSISCERNEKWRKKRAPKKSMYTYLRPFFLILYRKISHSAPFWAAFCGKVTAITLNQIIIYCDASYRHTHNLLRWIFRFGTWKRNLAVTHSMQNFMWHIKKNSATKPAEGRRIQMFTNRENCARNDKT